MTAAPVILINAFEVPEGEDEVFLAGWERARAFLSTQEGYMWTHNPAARGEVCEPMSCLSTRATLRTPRLER